MARTPALSILVGDRGGDRVALHGTREALELLRDRIDRALDRGHAAAEFHAAIDGTSFDLFVHLAQSDALQNVPHSYLAPRAQIRVDYLALGLLEEMDNAARRDRRAELQTPAEPPARSCPYKESLS